MISEKQPLKPDTDNTHLPLILPACAEKRVSGNRKRREEETVTEREEMRYVDVK